MFRTKIFVLLLAAVAVLPVAAPQPASADTLTFTGSVSATGTRYSSHAIQVGEASTLGVKLSWSGAADLNLSLKRPDGTTVVRTTGPDHPETLVREVGVGSWIVGITARAGTANYALVVDITPQTFSGAVNASSAPYQTHRVTFGQRTTVTASLAWAGAGDLNLFVKQPDGTTVARSDGTANPETVSTTLQAGTWLFYVRARSGSATYTLSLKYGTESPPVEPTPPSMLRVWAAENEADTHTKTEADAIADAVEFNSLVANRRTYPAHVGAMKGANPNHRLHAYVMGTFAWKEQSPGVFPQAWYLKDANGRYVQMKGQWVGHYLMNPAHSGWIDNRSRECASVIASTGYDGCMLDMLGIGAINADSLVTAAPINPATGREYTEAQWQNATGRLAAAVKSFVSPHGVIANGLRSGANYFDPVAPSRIIADQVDGGVAEAWLRGATMPLTSFRSEAGWLQDVEMLVDAGARGKSAYVLVKLWASGTLAQKDVWHEFALATFLLGTDGKSNFALSYSPDSDPTVRHPWWDADIGPATSGYVRRDNVYQRDFSNGRIIVNPGSEPYAVRLGGTFVDLRGLQRTGTITVQPRQGLVLRNAG